MKISKFIEALKQIENKCLWAEGLRIRGVRPLPYCKDIHEIAKKALRGVR